MILKKPYAFLIKNFRAIHILLTLLCVYITYKTTGVISFFREYIANNYSVTVTDNLVTSTISPLTRALGKASLLMRKKKISLTSITNPLTQQMPTTSRLSKLQ